MRIARSDVECSIKNLNSVLNRSAEAWRGGQWQKGNYHLISENNAYSLYVVANDSGGCHDLLTGCTLREVNLFVRGMILGAIEKARHA